MESETTREHLQAFSDRLNAALDAIHFAAKGKGRQVQLGVNFGVTQKAARKWLEAESIPRMGALKELSEWLQCDIEWLLTGNGRPPAALAATGVVAEPIRDATNAEPGPAVRGKVPLISSIQAGAMSDATDIYAAGFADEWIKTTAPIHKHTYALRVRGDSMEPDIPSGFVVIVEPDLEPVDGDVVVAKNGDGEANIKYLVKVSGDWYLKPANRAYPPKPLGDAQVIGVVREIVRRLR